MKNIGIALRLIYVFLIYVFGIFAAKNNDNICIEGVVIQ